MSAAATPERPSARIADEILSWEGITTKPGRFGSTEYYYGTREVGHVHGDRLADLPFPTKLRNELVAARRAEPHHFLPDTGWVTVRLNAPEDVDRVLDLFRLNYDLIRSKKQSARAAPGA